MKEIDYVPGKQALLTLLLLVLVFYPDLLDAQQGFTLTSPHRSESRTRRVIDDLVLDALLTYDYSESDQTDVDWKTESIPGLRGKRFLYKNSGQGGTLTLEIAYSPAPAGGYQIYLYGRQFDAQGSISTNPDLADFKARAEFTITQAKTAQSSGPEDVDYQLYSLSYLQADRALGLLKSLGYTTVEYTMSAGETPNDRVYSTFMTGQWKLPVVIKLIDSTKSSLMDSPPAGTYQQQRAGAVTDLGGTYLHQQTSGEPQQRLLIAYDRNNLEPVQDLLNLLRQKVDLPSRQIVIEALVIEINTDKMRDLGVNLRAIDSNYDASFEKEASTGTDKPFTFTFNRNAFSDVLFFRTGLTALMESGDAEILSSPSVLVLDGRQARIQIGQQVPVSKSVSTTSGFSSGVEYIQTGIVLNLRPRINEDGDEITMQVETIVSAVNEDLSIQTAGDGGSVLLAPRVDNRQVQTFVRVADNTPFIIGGLISTEKKERTVGIPILSQIPILGLPFRRKSTESIKKEVIVVLTPHVVPVGEKNFSYVIPKDSDMFNAFGNTLFRNGYRIRDDDVFDLKFLYQSDIFQSLILEVEERAEAEPGFGNEPPFRGLLAGDVPGEEVLVRRMLWEIVLKTGFAENIDVDRIITFEEYPAAPDSSGFRTRFLNQLLGGRTTEGNTLALTFDASTKGTVKHPFVPPKARIGYQTLQDGDNYVNALMKGNRPLPDGSPKAWSVLLSEVKPSGVRGATGIEVLQGVLVLKRILALNKSLPLTIREFRVGRQIIFPTEQDLKQRFHIIDRDAARFFYEVIQYYPEFEQSFNRRTRQITQILRHGR
jgi:Flp pilus assembly secretin CpaC